MDEDQAARAREIVEIMEQRRVTPENWSKLDVSEQLQWLVENTTQVLRPRPRFMRFRAHANRPLEGPFFLEGPAGERIEAEQTKHFERLRHEAIREVAQRLAAAPPSDAIGREAEGLIVLLDQAAQARKAGEPKAELISHIERLLGSVNAKLLRPDADRTRQTRARLLKGRSAENRHRAEEAARRHAAEVELIRNHLRQRPEARNTDIARRIRRDGRTTLSLNSLRQLVGKLRREEGRKES